MFSLFDLRENTGKWKIEVYADYLTHSLDMVVSFWWQINYIYNCKWLNQDQVRIIGVAGW
jgi:hypothetical protein